MYKYNFFFKDMSFEELKADCLIQLLCMSKKRVLATLEGKLNRLFALVMFKTVKNLRTKKFMWFLFFI